MPLHHHEDRQSLVDTITFLETEVSKLAVENEALQRDLKRFDRERRSLESRSISSQRQIADLEKMLRMRDDQLERADRHIRELSEKVRDLQEDRQHLDHDIHHTEDRYERELQVAERKNRQLRERIDTLEETCTRLKKERDQLQQQPLSLGKSHTDVADDLLFVREPSHASIKGYNTPNGNLPRSMSYQVN
ncbi:unnamed protein product, partial [Mesorhabditis spiculigera]